MDLFDNSGGTDGVWRYCDTIADHSTHFLVALAPLETKSATGVLAVVSGGAALAVS